MKISNSLSQINQIPDWYLSISKGNGEDPDPSSGQTTENVSDSLSNSLSPNPSENFKLSFSDQQKVLWIRWFALFLPLYQIGGLVLFCGDRRCYDGGFGMGILCGGSMVVCGGMVYWVYDFFFGGGFTSGGVVCSAAVVEWGCWGFLFCFDFL